MAFELCAHHIKVLRVKIQSATSEGANSKVQVFGLQSFFIKKINNLEKDHQTIVGIMSQKRRKTIAFRYIFKTLSEMCQ